MQTTIAYLWRYPSLLHEKALTHLKKMGEYGRIVLGLLDFYLSPRI